MPCCSSSQCFAVKFIVGAPWGGGGGEGAYRGKGGHTCYVEGCPLAIVILIIIIFIANCHISTYHHLDADLKDLILLVPYLHCPPNYLVVACIVLGSHIS